MALALMVEVIAELIVVSCVAAAVSRVDTTVGDPAVEHPLTAKRSAERSNRRMRY